MSHYFDSQPSSAQMEKEIHVRLNGQEFRFITDHSVFSRQRLDAGSEMLLETVLKDHPVKSGRLLDLGCGYGAIGIMMKRFRPALSVVLCDINERAIGLARKNAAGNLVRFIEIIQSDGLAAVPGTFDLILTNPPIRAGKQTVYRFFSEAAERLNPGGALYIVIRRQQGAPSAKTRLEELFSAVVVIDRSSGYWIIKAGHDPF